MARKHTFVVLVLLGAVVVAGLLAVSRTVLLAQPSQAATGTDPAIAFRMKKLDRFEAKLRRQAAELGTARASAPSQITIYRRPPAVQVTRAQTDDDHGYEHESELGESDD